MDRELYDSRWEQEQQAEADAYTWFHDLYFDPVAEVSAGIKRRYRWLPEDTISPYDVLFTRFGHAISHLSIARIANELSATSSNWRTRPDEFGDAIEENRPPRTNTNNTVINAERQDLLDEIAALNDLISTIRRPRPAFDHNKPPEGIDDDGPLDAEWNTLGAALEKIEVQARSAEPDMAAIKESQKTLIGFGQQVMTWGGGRGTKFVDAVLDSSGKALGAALVLQLTGLLPHLFAVITKVSHFVDALSN